MTDRIAVTIRITVNDRILTGRIARIVLFLRRRQRPIFNLRESFMDTGLLQKSQTQEIVTKPIMQDWKGAGGVEPGLRIGVMGLFLGNFFRYMASNEGEDWLQNNLQNNITFHKLFSCEC